MANRGFDEQMHPHSNRVALQHILDSYIPSHDRPSTWPICDDDGLAAARDATCSQLVSQLLQAPVAGNEEFISIQDLVINDSADDLLLPRLARDWVHVVVGALQMADRRGCQRFSTDCAHVVVSEIVAFHLGSLASSPGCITVYEILRSLGPEFSRAADAMQLFSQQRLFAACQCIQFDSFTDQVDIFLRSGASFLHADNSGRVAAHMAAQSGNPMLGHIVRSAPVALLVEDEHGQTPLELLWGILNGGDPCSDLNAEIGADILKALTDAALECLASYPEQTVKVLNRSQTAAEVWAMIAKASGSSALYAASGWDAHDSLGQKLDDMQDHTDSLVAELRHRKQRILLLEALAEDLEFKLSELEPRELKLTLAKAQRDLEEQQKAFSCRLDELEQQNRDLRNTLIQRDEEILELKSSRSHQHVGSSSVQVMSHDLSDHTRAGKTVQSVLGGEDEHNDSRESTVAQEEKIIFEISSSRQLGAEPTELPQQLRQGIVEMRASLAAAVGRLAHDLYESKAHFLQELLQNADDNRYDTDVIPTVRFVLQAQSAEASERPFFYATNNESGMTEKDVRSLCDISRSSKAGFDEGVTGCKGVGWKSVFRVSNNPHVLCRQWRFKFSSQGLGMITPQWIQEAEFLALPQEIRAAHAEGLTVFYLPLAEYEHVVSIEAEMKVMKADIAQLLFLRRVRQLHLHCSPKSPSVCVSLAGESGSTARTVAVSESPKCKDANKADVQTEVCFEVCQHESVSLAFPLMQELEPQRIFAVLPVRAAGFRFAINAPFDLTASRTSLHHSPENAARRDAVVVAFLHCCEANSEIATRALEYLGHVPTDSFWLPVRMKILEGLQGVRCVLTEAGAVQPQECLLRGDLPAAPWVPDHLLWSACRLHFISEANLPDTMHDLGIRTFGYTELEACLRAAVDQNWIQAMWKHPSRSALLSDIYVSLFQCLQEEPDRLPDIAALSIFPVSHGAFVNFVAANATGTRICSALCDEFPSAWQLPLVRCLSNELEVTGQAIHLLKALDIEELDAEELVRLALSALLRNSDQLESPNSMFWGALAIIQRCFYLDKAMPRPWSEIRDSLLLASDQGAFKPAGSLRLASFLGMREILPKSVIDKVFEIGGFCIPQRFGGDYAALPPSCMLAEGSTYFQWEVFFWTLGCAPADPTGRLAETFVEATLQLGNLLASGAFWTSASRSPAMLEYLDAVIGEGSCSSRCCWLRRLPVRFQEMGPPVLLEDLFLHDVFHPLAGAHLYYLEGAPSSPRVLTFLRRLGVATEISNSTLLKCLRCLRQRNVEDVGLVSDVYRELGSHSCGVVDEALIMVPGKGYLAPDKCSWEPFQNTFLRTFCRLVSLSEHYLRFGQDVSQLLQSWVQDRPESDALELCDTLLIAIMAISTGTDRRDQSQVLFDQLVEGARYVVVSLARLCFEEEERSTNMSRPNADMAINFFGGNRMILIPSSDPMGAFPNVRCRALLPTEAYWSVTNQLKDTSVAACALDAHYGKDDAQIEHFFCNVLGVRKVLDATQLDRLAQQQACPFLPIAMGSDSNRSPIGLGLNLQDLSRNITQSKMRNSAFHSGQAATAALEAARRCNRPDHERQPATHAAQDTSGSNSAAHPAARTRSWHCIWVLDGLPVYVTSDMLAGSSSLDLPQVLSQFGVPDTGLIYRLCSLFSVFPNQIGFAFDSSGRSVCSEHLLLDISRVPRSLQQPGNVARITFWLMEIAMAVAHQGVGPAINEHLCQVQAELVASFLPIALTAELGFSYM